MRESVDTNREPSPRRRKRDRIKDFAKKIVGINSTQSSSDEGASSSGSNEKTAIATTPKPDDYKKVCRPPICSIPLKEHDAVGLSLAGCGFLSTYHFGVIKCFQRNGKTLMSRLTRVSGASAGSLVSAVLVLAPHELDRSMAAIYDMSEEIHALPFGALSPGFFLGERLVEILEKFIPQDISEANNKLFISITHHKTRENRLVSTFPNRAYLIKCLSASCYISMYSMGVTAKPPEVDGQPYCDGGYTNNQPDYSDLRTITVSPFCSKNDISPPDDKGFDWNLRIANQHFKVSFRNIMRGAQSIFPPSRTTLKLYYDQGYRDAFKFLLENDMLERDTGSEV